MTTRDIERDVRVRDLSIIYKNRGLDSPEIRSFLAGIDLDTCISTDSRVLEVGCGIGNFLRDVKSKYGAKCIGADKFPTLSEKNEGIKILEADAESLPFGNSSFDFVFSYFTFPYVPDKLKSLSEVYRVLDSGGTAIIDLGTLDISRQDDSRLVDRYMYPPFEVIKRAYESFYESNKRKISLERVNIFSEKGSQIRRAMRVSLRKRGDEPLYFPKLKRHEVNSENGFPTVMSYY